MKKKMVFMLILISLPYLCFAASSNANGMNVSFDIPSLVSTVNVTFTNKAISTGFKDYENIPETSKAPAIELSVVNDAGVIRGMSSSFYVSYQIYLGNVVDIIIKPEGPLKQVDGTSKLNWQVFSVENESLFAGTLADNKGETEYKDNASFIVYTSKLTDVGLSGSKPLQVKTQDLQVGVTGKYKANLTAIVNVR